MSLIYVVVHTDAVMYSVSRKNSWTSDEQLERGANEPLSKKVFSRVRLLSLSHLAFTDVGSVQKGVVVCMW